MLGQGCCAGIHGGGLGDATSDYLAAAGSAIGNSESITQYDTGNYNQAGFPTTYNGPSGLDWLNGISKAFAPIANIFSARYAIPQLAPGQYIQQTPYGSIMSQSATGIPQGGGILSTGSSSLGSMLPILLIGGVILMVVAKK